MEEHYNSNILDRRRIYYDYGYVFEDDLLNTINEVRANIPLLYKNLGISEKKLLMELILKDPELL